MTFKDYFFSPCYVHTCMDNLQELVFLFHHVNPRFKLRLSGLVASTEPSYWLFSLYISIYISILIYILLKKDILSLKYLYCSFSIFLYLHLDQVFIKSVSLINHAQTLLVCSVSTV